LNIAAQRAAAVSAATGEQATTWPASTAPAATGRASPSSWHKSDRSYDGAIVIAPSRTSSGSWSSSKAPQLDPAQDVGNGDVVAI
jgi:RES domain-containing protein